MVLSAVSDEAERMKMWETHRQKEEEWQKIPAHKTYQKQCKCEVKTCECHNNVGTARNTEFSYQ